MGAGGIRLFGNGGAQLLLRALAVAALDQGDGEIVASFPILGVEMERGFERRECAGIQALLREERTERVIGPGRGMVGDGIEKLPKRLGSLGGVEARARQRLRGRCGGGRGVTRGRGLSVVALAAAEYANEIGVRTATDTTLFRKMDTESEPDP